MIVALNDIQDEVFLDASFLEQLLPGAIKITLAEGEKKVQTNGRGWIAKRGESA